MKKRYIKKKWIKYLLYKCCTKLSDNKSWTWNCLDAASRREDKFTCGDK